jgi:hypothetical protein
MRPDSSLQFDLAVKFLRHAIAKILDYLVMDELRPTLIVVLEGAHRDQVELMLTRVLTPLGLIPPAGDLRR